MDPHAVGATAHPRFEPVESARPAPRKPASPARRGALIAAFVGAGLVAFFALVLVSSNVGLVVGDNNVACSAHGGNSVVDVSHGDRHDLCAQKPFSTMPADDAALEAWLRAQPGVQAVEVRRVGDSSLAVRLQYLHGDKDVPQWLLSPPWEDLGYQPASGVSPSLLGGSLPPLSR